MMRHLDSIGDLPFRGIDQEITPDLRRQLRTVVLATCCMVCAFIPFVAAYTHYGAGLVTGTAGVVCLLAMINLVALRTHLNPRRAGTYGAALAYALIVVESLHTGGFYDPGFAAIYVVPLVAALLGGYRAGIAFAALAIGTTVAFWMRAESGVPLPNVVPEGHRAIMGLVNRMTTVLVIGALMGLVGAERRVLSRLLKATRDALQQEKVTVRAVTDQLEQTEQFATMGGLISGVGHEINNPLAVALGNIELVEEALDDGEPLEDLRPLLEEALDGLERVGATVADLKTFSRVDRGEAERVDVRNCITQALKLTAHETHHRAQVTADLGGEPQIVIASPGRLVQVFVSLLNNAAQAIPPGAADKNRVAVRLQCQNGRIEVRISDSGVGFDPALADSLFEPFFTTHSIGEATGLGLSICRNTVEQLGGALTLINGTDGGAVATVQLPKSLSVDPAK